MTHLPDSTRTITASIIAMGLCLSSSALGATLDVPAGFATIQAAVDAAVDGDIVAVAPGVYFEAVEIDKSITLVGTGTARSEVVIRDSANWYDSGRDAITLYVSGDQVEIYNLTVKNTFDQTTASPSHAIVARFDKRANVENVFFDGGTNALNVRGDVLFNRVTLRGAANSVWGTGSGNFMKSVFVMEGNGSVFAQDSAVIGQGSFNVYDSTFLNDGASTIHVARPWGTHSTVRVVESTFSSSPTPARYLNSPNDGRDDTIYFVECGNKGNTLTNDAVLVTPCKSAP